MPDQRQDSDNNQRGPTGKGPQGPGKPPNGDMRFSRSTIAWLLIAAMVILVLVLTRSQNQSSEHVDLMTFWDQLDKNNIQTLTVRDDGTILAERKTHLPGEAENDPLHIVTRMPPSALDGTGLSILQKESTDHRVEKFNSEPSSNIWLTLPCRSLPGCCLAR